MSLARSSLLGGLDLNVSLDAPLGSLTWFGIGGHADMLVSPRSEEALIHLIQRCHEQDVKVRVFGGGANLLIDDAGVSGVVLRLDDECFRRIRYNAVGEVGAAIVGAGVDLFGFVQDTKRRGLAGFEMMAGIPGTVGGAVRMNAGGAWGEISTALQSVDHLSWDGQHRTFDAATLGFRYRGSDLPSGVILSAKMSLQEDDPVTVSNRVKEIFQHKRSSQPMGESSAGCAFRNPDPDGPAEGRSAGALIDQAGLKGHRIGGAVVSDQHGNFVVAESGANASDVHRLMDDIQARVLDRFGVELSREIVFWSREEQ